MSENKYSIRQFEELVHDGTMTKRVVKSTYTREFLSRTIHCLKAGAYAGGVMTALLAPLAFAKPDTNYSDISEFLLINFGMWGGFSTLLASLPAFHNWRENSRQYVEAGGKIIYQHRTQKTQFVLPKSNSSNKEEKIKFEERFTGYIDPLR